MKKNLLSVLLLFVSVVIFAQGKVEVNIIQTDASITDSVWVEDPVTEEDTLFAVITLPLSSDDAEEIWEHVIDGGEPVIDDLNDDDLDMGWEGEEDDLNIVSVGLRFQNLDIPQGATIDSAFILVYSHEEKGADDIAKLTIWADNTDDAETFTEDTTFTTRNSTTASVTWTVDYEWGLWTLERTPDLKTIVQEIVNRTGWQSGNSMAFIFEGENQGISEVENAREFESFENIEDPEEGGDGLNHPERAPKLVVYYDGYTASIETNEINLFNVYPNPADQNFVVELSTMEEAFVSILDITGKEIYSTSMNSYNKTFDVSEYANGVYFLKVSQGQETDIQKLIIK